MVENIETPFNFFNAIFCISSNDDKWEEVSLIFKKWSIFERVERFSISNENNIKKCLEEIINIAKKRNLENLLIFEDTFIVDWDNNSLESLNNSLKQAKLFSWKILVLGGEIHEPASIISDHLAIFRPKRINLTYKFFSYAINSSIFDTLLKYWESSNLEHNLFDCLFEKNSYNYFLFTYPFLVLNSNNSMFKDNRIKFDNDGINKLLTQEKIKSGLAISTYISKNNQNRLKVFKESIKSLLNTNFDGPIFLIDDCSNTDEHLNFVKDYDKDKRITLYVKKERAGISKIKNTSIRLLLDSNVDILFLADDDVYYLQKDWSNKFIETMLKTKFSHLNIPQPYDSGILTFVNNYPLLKFNKNPKGLIMTFTKHLINTTGYFNIFPKFYGWEHINYSKRCLNNRDNLFHAGIMNSKNVITDCSTVMGLEEDKCRSLPKIDQIKQAHNNYKFLKLGDTLECIE